MQFLWDTQQVQVFSGSDNPTFLVCLCIILWDLVTICWHYILILAHKHHLLSRKYGQPLEFSSKLIPWRHKACPNGTFGVLHTASIYLVEHKELKDSTRCNLVGKVWRIDVLLPWFWNRTISQQVQGRNCLFCWVQSLHISVPVIKILVPLPEAIIVSFYSPEL